MAHTPEEAPRTRPPTVTMPGAARGQACARWIVSQEGSRQSYAIPLGFQKLGVLRVFYADVWCRWGRSWLRHGTKATRTLATRFHPDIPEAQVVSFSPATVARRALYHLRRGSLSPAQSADQFCRFGTWFARRVRNHLATVELDPDRDRFLGFNTNCLETLELLRARGVFTVVDQVDPGKVEEEMVREEAARWPGWEKAPGRIPQSYWDRLKAEWEMADLVLVNSAWSAGALVEQGVPGNKIAVVPLALDLRHDHEFAPVDPSGTLRVLWLGSVVIRKGIQYLAEAARHLEGRNIQFLLAGPMGVSELARRSFPPNMKLLGRITRDQLTKVYRQAHIFVLPTLSDGFAVTQLEAMAHGLPVVTTPNCGHVVTDGLDGVIVPARDSQALAEALARLEGDRQLVRAMSSNALLTVSKYDVPSNARLICQAVEARAQAAKQEKRGPRQSR